MAGYYSIDDIEDLERKSSIWFEEWGEVTDVGPKISVDDYLTFFDDTEKSQKDIFDVYALKNWNQGNLEYKRHVNRYLGRR